MLGCSRRSVAQPFCPSSDCRAGVSPAVLEIGNRRAIALQIRSQRIIARYDDHGSCPSCSRAVGFDNSFMSASTMISTSSRKRTFGSQSRIFFAFAGIADEKVDLRRTFVARVVLDVFLPVEIDVVRRRPRRNSRTVCVSLVARTKSSPLVLLQDAPHAFDIFRRVTPVAFGIEIAEE